MTAIPYTDLRGQVLCTLPLPYARLLVSPDGELSHITAPLVFMSSILVFKVSVQVTSLDCLPLTVSRLVFLGYTGLWQSETQSLIDYHPQVLHRQRLKDIPSLCERLLFSYHGALARWASFRSGTHLRAYGATLREHRPEDAIFMFCLWLTMSHQYLLKKSLYTCLELWFLWLPPRGNLQIAEF